MILEDGEFSQEIGPDECGAVMFLFGGFDGLRKMMLEGPPEQFGTSDISDLPNADALSETGYSSEEFQAFVDAPENREFIVDIFIDRFRSECSGQEGGESSTDGLAPVDDVAPARKQELAIGESGTLNDGTKVLLTSVRVGDNGRSPLLTIAARFENPTAADTVRPNFGIVCAGSDERGQRYSTVEGPIYEINGADDLLAGSFIEAQTYLLLPGDGIPLGEPFVECAKPALIEFIPFIFGGAKSDATISYPLDDYLVDELNQIGKQLNS